MDILNRMLEVVNNRAVCILTPDIAVNSCSTHACSTTNAAFVFIYMHEDNESNEHVDCHDTVLIFGQQT